MRLVKNIDKILNQLKEELLNTPREMLILRLTLIFLILHGLSSLTSQISLRVICMLMLMSNKLTVSRYLWIVISIIIVSVHGLYWYSIDNHMYLMTYWCLVCTIAVWNKKVFDILYHNARILIGLTFCFATFWKMWSLQYFDGTFLNFTLLTDNRMKLFSFYGGGLDLSIIHQNYENYGLFLSHPNIEKFQYLISTERLRVFSIVFSYLTLLIEGFIGVMFLLKKSFKNHFIDYIFISFIVFTYIFFPVIGFGFILCILGISQVNKNNNNLFLVYITLIILLQITLIPFDKLILG